MKILAFEFSSPRRSVALGDAADAHHPRLLAEVADGVGGQRGALAMVEEVLAKAGVGRAQVDCIMVGTGPGSYTGIRMAIALAQGWQLARDIRLLGIPSTDALARQLWLDGRRGQVHLAIDAQRGEFYHAVYELEDGGETVIQPLAIVPRATLDAIIAVGDVVVTPENPPRPSKATAEFPTATALVNLAANQKDFLQGEQLEPVYLREASFAKAPQPRNLPV